MNEARQQERFKMNRPLVPGPRSLPQPARAPSRPQAAMMVCPHQESCEVLHEGTERQAKGGHWQGTTCSAHTVPLGPSGLQRAPAINPVAQTRKLRLGEAKGILQVLVPRLMAEGGSGQGLLTRFHPLLSPSTRWAPKGGRQARGGPTSQSSSGVPPPVLPATLQAAFTEVMGTWGENGLSLWQQGGETEAHAAELLLA